MKPDLYNFRLGQAFAREMIESAPSNLSVQPIIDKLLLSLSNKPKAQQDGIQSVIWLINNSTQAMRAQA